MSMFLIATKDIDR